jgi:hypothetical protein
VRRLTAAVIVVAMLAAWVTSASGGELRIYLVEDSLSYDEISSLADLSSLHLKEPPLLTSRDIESYEWATHTMKLKPECGMRLFTTFAQRTRHPMISHPFVVAVDSLRIYMGALNSMYSSWSASNVPRIGIPFEDAPVSALRIAGATAGRGKFNDPRNDPRIRAALEQAGVLVDE